MRRGERPRRTDGSGGVVRARAAVGIAAVILWVATAPGGSAADGGTTRLSAASGRPRSDSFRPWITPDGLFVAFDSDAPLVPADGNGLRDVFVHDRSSGQTFRVSVATGGIEANGDSQRPVISADGRFVAFWSTADNLVAGDSNQVADAFLHDRASGETRRVSVTSDGGQADGESARPVLSADGSTIAFESAATNLVPADDRVPLLGGDDDAPLRHIYVHDVATGRTTRADVASDGTPGAGESVRPSLSADGRYVAFHTDVALVAEDRNGARDVYVHDRETGLTTRVSVATGGAESNRGGSFSPSISADGRYVAFYANAGALVADDSNRAADVFVHDRQTGETTRVSLSSEGIEADGGSYDPSISPDGRFVSFYSEAPNLVPHDGNDRTDVFVRDRTAGTTVRISVASNGAESDDHSYSPSVNADGTAVAFDSRATNLDSDLNPGSDVFIHVAAANTASAGPPAAPPAATPSG
jgi:Tol biopolymer transport system component